MNRHELADVVTIGAASRLVRDATLFDRSLSSPPLIEVLDGATVRETDPGPLADHHAVEVETAVGTFEAAYLDWRWLGPGHPTLLYHHGSDERPFDFGRFSTNSFRRIFASGAPDCPCNLIALRAPFHERSAREYADALGDLSAFVGMVAASTALVEALRARLVAAGSPAVTVSGISLGGFVTTLHRAALDSADRYVPLLAGASLGELFVSSVYRWLTGSRARANPERLRAALDFDDAFRAVDADDCRPLLARHDRVVEFDRQRPGYAGMDVGVIEKGHVTGALADSLLRTWVERHVAGTPAGDRHRWGS